MSNKYTGTNAARLALTTMKPGEEFEETDTGSAFKYTTAGWVQTHVGGAAQITTNKGVSLPSPRELVLASAAVDSATFTEVEDILHVILTPYGTVGQLCYVTFDAPDLATGTYRLAQAGGESTPALRETLIVGQQYEWFAEVGSPFRRIDAVWATSTAGVGISVQAGK